MEALELKCNVHLHDGISYTSLSILKEVDKNLNIKPPFLERSVNIINIKLKHFVRYVGNWIIISFHFQDIS